MRSTCVIALAWSLPLLACGSDASQEDPGFAGDGDSSAGDGDGSAGDGDGPAGDGDSPAGDGDGAGGESIRGLCGRRHCYAAELYTCFQWSADDAQHEELCGGFGGKVEDGGCPSDDLVPTGCKRPSPFGGDGCAINWVYEPLTAVELSDTCAGELVTP